MDTPLMETLRWLRVPGDTVFALGAIAFAFFVFTTRSGAKKDRPEPLPLGKPQEQL